MSRLDLITDWESRAEQVRFNVGALARGCGVTDRQLRRHFQIRFGSGPHAWMALARLQKVQPLLSGGALVKEVAVEAGYSKQTNFTREFKRYYKANPTDFRDTVGGFPGGILQKCPNSIKDVRFRLTNSVDRSGVTVVNR